jgi:hypothetical protein
MRTALLVAAALLLPITAGHAQHCAEFTDRTAFAELAIAQVKQGQTRVPFSKADCASTKPGACQSQAYVMPGDVVLVGQVFDASACAVYVNPKGQVTTGLLPNERLRVPSPRPETGASALVGIWTRAEAEIVIKPKGRAGMLSFDGNATYGALDTRRVARGAVNLGEFNFDLTPAGNTVDVLLDGAEPVVRKTAKASADETGCSVAMIALGPYLVVEDNRNCGGVNVSFTGFYRRTGAGLTASPR